MIYPLLITTVKNNLEIGTENKIILELNKKDDMLGIYPILLVTRYKTGYTFDGIELIIA
ncbi:hypothetical protein H8356DRAFT_1328588 [Neocallimastix lanati (nom. inval.)]|nr:hypothetical protein H8356DRAFT_1328588 [Neocallimastix sp. JGI-2020a]